MHVRDCDVVLRFRETEHGPAVAPPEIVNDGGFVPPIQRPVGEHAIPLGLATAGNNKGTTLGKKLGERCRNGLATARAQLVHEGADTLGH